LRFAQSRSRAAQGSRPDPLAPRDRGVPARHPRCTTPARRAKCAINPNHKVESMKKRNATEAPEKLVLSKETLINLAVRTGIKAGESQARLNSCRTQ
jgi:hypothetical protein